MALQSLNSGTASQGAQLNRYQVKLQQARREAAQAEGRVNRLEQQTQAARGDAARSKTRVRELEGDPPRADETRRPDTQQASRRTINTFSQLRGTLLDVTA